MTTEAKLLLAAVILDLLWVASIAYVVHDTARRRTPRVKWILGAIACGPLALAHWLVIGRRRAAE